ncbi:TetR/AcrR family transcriptional regulator [Maritalea sp. S77]|uniref:TetR/AcrR family transcriptional regulator n=1 Tax=Maritalea sp. S77 TaxID=3415125 RepID=UPI003C7C6663
MTNLKDQLLDIAFNMFLAQGYDGVGLSEVIKKAGVSKGALYHHFSSKEDLIDQVLQRYFLDGFAQTDFGALASVPATTQLALLVEIYQTQFGPHAAMAQFGLARYFALFFDSIARNERFAAAIKSYYQKIESALQPEARPFLRQIEGEIYLSTVLQREPDFSFIPASA